MIIPTAVWTVVLFILQVQSWENPPNDLVISSFTNWGHGRLQFFKLQKNPNKMSELFDLFCFLARWCLPIFWWKPSPSRHCQVLSSRCFRELAIVFLGRNLSFSESYCGAKWHKSRNMAEQTAPFFNVTINGRSSMKGQQLFTCSMRLNWRREHCVIWCSTCGTVICFHLFQWCSLFQRFLQNAECTICSWTNSFSLNANSLELLWHDKYERFEFIST